MIRVSARPRVWLLRAAVAAVWCLAGCGDPATSSSDGATTTADPAGSSFLRAPGTRIAGAVRVEPGSSLVATAFPLHGQWETGSTDGGPDGWQALVVVDGDPIAVWDRYARALGVDDWASAREACVVRHLVRPVGSWPDSGLSSPDRLLTDPPGSNENQLRCSAQDATVHMAMRYGVEVQCAQPPSDTPDCQWWPTRHLYLAVSPRRADSTTSTTWRHLEAEGPLYERAGGAPVLPTVPDAPIVPPRFTDDSGAASRPGPGQRIDAGLDQYLNNTDLAIMPPGGQSLVEPALPISCNSGLASVIRLPGSPTAAVRHFDGATSFDDPGRVTSGRWGGRDFAHVGLVEVGGYGLEVTAVADPDGTSVVLLTECGD